jgi:uncharacterized OB-fold protein
MAIIPAATELTRPYWENARDGRLVLQRCNNCRQIWHPPLPACPHCHSTNLGWHQVSGTGTVYTYTVVRHATHAALAGHIPYVIAIVELAEGPRIVTGITGCGPNQVRAGMEVRVRFEPVTDELALPYFEPVEPAQAS